MDEWHAIAAVAAAMSEETLHYQRQLDQAVAEFREGYDGMDHRMVSSLMRVIALDQLRCEAARVNAPIWEETLARERLLDQRVVDAWKNVLRRGGTN